MTMPMPVVTVGGVVLPTGGPLAGQVVLDPLSVTWGRTELVAQPEPATGSLAVFDTSNRWAQQSAAAGTPVVLSTVLGGVDTPFFRGRIGEGVKIRPWRTQGIDGTLVQLPLRSLLLDLANTVPTVAWPAEQVTARLARLTAACAAVLPGGVLLDGSYAFAQMAAVPATEQVSLLEHLTALFASCGADSYTYSPAGQRVQAVKRRTVDRGVGALAWDGPTGAGAYASINTRSQFTDWTEFPPDHLHLDAAGLVYDPADGITAPVPVTRVQVNDPVGVTEVPVAGMDETALGVRAAAVDSQFTTAPELLISANSLASVFAEEGAAWLPGPLEWREAIGGPLTDRQARLLLAGCEVDPAAATGDADRPLFFLQRSWLARYGIRPIFGLRGATLTYADGGWSVAAALHPPGTGGFAEHAITWDEIDDGSAEFQLEWHDGPHPRGLHETLTYEDAGHLARGLNCHAIGPDTGWDTRYR